MTLITVATCNLNQWAMDFDGNLERIYNSCMEAKRQCATYRLGPELEICGYGCEDHFFESDTIQHCWESLLELLNRGVTDDGMICDFGMPVLHRGTRYNCRIICQNRQILLIRPKIALADNGNYRESRYFTAYHKEYSSSGSSSGSSNSANGRDNGEDEQYLLPTKFREEFGQKWAPFGIRPIQFGVDDVVVGCESCEELWTPAATHIAMSLSGVDIITNGSGSHAELRKLNTRLDLIVNATRKCGGLYLYSNQRGCDGGRLYYDGGCLIVLNGIVLAQGSQFSLQDVEVVSATVDIDEIRSYRASIPSFGIQAQRQQRSSNFLQYPNASFNNNPHTTTNKTKKNNKNDNIDCSSTTGSTLQRLPTLLHNKSNYPKFRHHSPEEECCLGPACWLWDYLRRSGASGYFLPLSGGADSSSVAAILHVMCTLVTAAAQQDPTGTVANDIRRICNCQNSNNNNNNWVPSKPQDIANRIIHTVYMGTTNSSAATKSRAQRLGAAIGSYHLSITIDGMVAAVVQMFVAVTGMTPRFTVHGGTNSEDLALQNIQARLRMVTAYLFAQLLPWVRGTNSGFLLVLGSANVDEGLRGYMTKYDCSSADLNPIGAISKGDLKRMLLWISQNYNDVETILDEIANAPPTAELRPIQVTNNGNGSNDDVDEKTNDSNKVLVSVEHSQLDEEEMGMTYAELGLFGTLRKLSRCGPVGMYRSLCLIWNHLKASEVAVKVKRFFYFYAINRHKMCTITPAYHAEGYSPDDNRFDLRPFLYNVKWSRQFRKIDALVRTQESQSPFLTHDDDDGTTPTIITNVNDISTTNQNDGVVQHPSYNCNSPDRTKSSLDSPNKDDTQQQQSREDCFQSPEKTNVSLPTEQDDLTPPKSNTSQTLYEATQDESDIEPLCSIASF